jgi:hypothetical protein
VTVYEKAGGEKRPPPEAYLDANLVSGLARGDRKPEELAALYKIIDLMHEGQVSLVTSGHEGGNRSRSIRTPGPA